MSHIPNMYKNLDPADKFEKHLTKEEVIVNLKPTTFCHNLIVEVVKVSVSTKNKKVMNLEIKTQGNSRWAVVAWENDATRLENEVHRNHVYHIDGLYIQKVDGLSDFTFGKTLKFTLKSNTVLTDLTKMYLLSDEPVPLLEKDIKIYKSIQECVNENYKNNMAVGAYKLLHNFHDRHLNSYYLLGLDAFVKIPFAQGNIDISLRWGALTDGNIKITTMVKNFTDPSITFETGHSITAYGKVIEYKEKAAFEIAHIKEIKMNDSGHKTVTDLRNVVKTPKKPTRAGNSHTERTVSKVLKL
ncbi:hypothetical protein QAD02_005719 [Eretmocerus hayati]|uniref:Uncharacterized protein n=1 Tax=Eretmocerus hayati TaxID=131215 RepID=A0ACC2NW57_9HYME|nr:hypothetical protein QAD02_005719 [Eretmocerus hayati]